MKNLRFKVYMTLEVEEEENVLSLVEDGHEETIQDLIENWIFDIDGVDIKHIKVSLENTWTRKKHLIKTDTLR